MRLSGNRRLIVILLLGIMLIAGVVYTSGERTRLSYPEIGIREMFYPLEHALSRATGGIKGFFAGIAEMRSIRADNARLREEVERLRPLEISHREVLMENARLRALLGFTSSSESTYLPALVIGRNSDNWFSTAAINRGSLHGVRKDAPVVTPDGLVGRVIQVSPHTATVLLITDPESGVGGLVSASREAGVVLGQGGWNGQLLMRFFSRNALVGAGDVVVTSGLGMLYPKGIPIGTVSAVNIGDNNLVRYAYLVPAADILHLEEVLVLMKEGEAGR